VSNATTEPNKPGQIAGYDYGSPKLDASPVTLEELERLRETVGLTTDDERYLHLAAEVLVPQAEAIVDAWRQIAAGLPYLAVYSARPDGQPNPAYGAASKPRFIRWITDVCTRPLDQDWLNYQHEIALRHTRAKKNKTDHVESAAHIPLRFLLAFTAPAISVPQRLLEASGRSAAEIERMQTAWMKAVILHVTMWSRAYTTAENW
jgi:hypothetical protein